MDKISATNLVKQLSASPVATAPVASKDVVPGHTPTWDFEHPPVQIYEASIRGGGCAPSLLCERSMREQQADEEQSNRQVKLRIAQKEQDQKDEDEEGELAEHKSWPGWAELENDPEIFTILLQEWGVPNLSVHEILDIAELVTANSSDILGLIFLSRYIPPDPSASSKPAQKENLQKPWFANQISKFSCGTVALINILMNNQDIRLSETLSTFKHQTDSLNSKHKGIALDNHQHFRDIHNSFSTNLDRMIVDVLVKEDAQKWQQQRAAQARQGQGGATKKRKRGGRAPFTQRRKKAAAVDEDDENGFHFVAYVQAHSSVWKLDGMEAHPRLVGEVDTDLTWLNVAAEDLLQKMQEALQSGQECSLMSVTKTNTSPSQEEAQRLEKERKQEDWAPFIEFHCI
ncbi:hypothetical protein LTR70_001958 [Exophiala xenobiotica]|uniref:ubiquitinyl hydrolase 1 n=1 Tax=Lithohypha guttulata TaxID=1690604 RepID=A0ABR0K932_9EURO|nr:hypothetical protein LTR24_005371 [Lithohypha guttulata]KAK5326943.1 hypothetical protein LTR70_001958 [Exophiala xenobiotica]